MKLELKTCARCGRLFSSMKSGVCSTCEPDEENDFTRIRDVLSRTPGLNVEEVSKEAKVSVDCVLRMLEQGRIENTALANPVQCGQCGAPAISVSKRLCQACLTKLDQQYAEAIRDMREKIHPKKLGQAEVQEVRHTVDEKRHRLNTS